MAPSQLVLAENERAVAVSKGNMWAFTTEWARAEMVVGAVP